LFVLGTVAARKFIFLSHARCSVLTLGGARGDYWGIEIGARVKGWES
jgi:hypothetical protein